MTLKVLTVDDEENIRTAVRRTLAGYRISLPKIENEVELEVSVASSAEDGRAIIDKLAPHILLLDQKLPGMSGIELMQELSQSFSERHDAPLIIMITAYATIETAVQATKRGAYDFLPKPFTPEELRSTLKKAAEHVVVSLQARRLEAERKQIRFQFISVLAHELKAPLNAVQGFMELAQDQGMQLSAEDRNMIFERSAIRLKYMRKMIDDLLDLTRLESGQKRRELTSVNLRQVAETAIETALPDAQRRGIKITLESAGNLELNADQDEIEIIFNNLVSNAVKYNKPNGSVTVKITKAGNDLSIAVSDTGIGMTKEETERLFHDFVRIKNQKTRAIPGSGLGLSIVKKIAQTYGGSVAVASEPDVGSTFSVTLAHLP